MKAKNILIVLVLMMLAPLSSFQTQQAKAPEPEEFVAMFMESIRKDDSLSYVRRFALDTSDIRWTVDHILNDPYASPEEKSRVIERFIEDSARARYEFVRTSKQLGEGYEALRAWSKEQSIDLAKLELIDVFFTMRYQEDKKFYLLDDVDLIVKYESRYFHIEINKVVYLNNRWALGFIDDLEEVDQYFNEIKAPLDPTAFEYVTADTTVAAIEVPPPSKEEERIRAKITKQQTKINKLYNKLYTY